MPEKIDEYIARSLRSASDNKLNDLLDSMIEQVMLEKKITSPASSEFSDELCEAIDAYASTLLSPDTVLISEDEASSRAKDFLASLPKINITEEWGTPSTMARQEIKKFTENIPGKTVQESFRNLMQIQSPSSRISSQTRIIASLILLESLRSMIQTMNASAAGFAFEGFLAALMNGHQVAEPADGSLPIEDVMLFTYEGNRGMKTRPGTPVSLKLLKEGGVVKGSFTNMVDALYREEFSSGVSYVVAFKVNQDAEDMHLLISENILTKENFHSIMTHSNASSQNRKLFGMDLQRLNILRKMMPKNTPERSMLEAARKQWPKSLATPEKYGNIAGISITHLLLMCTQGYSVTKFKTNTSKLSTSASRLTEALKGDGGSQWYINASFYTSENVDIIGELKLSEAAIIQTAQQYSNILQKSISVLFSSVAALSEHINEYFIGKNRNSAMKSGKAAIEDTKSISKALKKEVGDGAPKSKSPLGKK